MLGKIYKFSNLFLARSFANRAVKLMMVLHGDHDEIWVTTPAVASRLEKQGYEII